MVKITKSKLNFGKTYKLSDGAFEVLTRSDPDLVTKMIRNQHSIDGFRAGNSMQISASLRWINDNATGLVYVINHNKTGARINYSVFFENEDDAVAFKLAHF